MDISEIKRNISIVEFLSKEGIRPVYIKKGGQEAWYFSPFRTETQASFKVDVRKGFWIDYADGQSGSIIDLYMLLKNATVKDAVFFFNREYSSENTVTRMEAFSSAISFKSNNQQGNNSTVIDNIIEIQTPALINYLLQRKIDINLAQQYVKEIHYHNLSGNYIALAFATDVGGYELRSPDFKGNIKGKSVTTFENNSLKCRIFEGFFDFLSYLSYDRENSKNSDYIVLNSSSFVKKMYHSYQNQKLDGLYITLSKYLFIETFFDRDTTGLEITQELNKLFPKSKDCSFMYQGFVDFNDFWRERE